MDLSLNPPQAFAEANDEELDRVESDFASGKVTISKTKIEKLEKELKKWIDRWKEGTSQLRVHLRENNDMMEGIAPDTDFPWPGASNVCMGVAAGMARTLAATFDRSIFAQERPLVAKAIAASQQQPAHDLEEAVNWLAAEDCNLIDTLRDTPIPIFRDGTVPVMGEWVRKIEKAVDYKTYQEPQSFQEDYPDHDTAGITAKKYDQVIKLLSSKYDPNVGVEYVYEAVTYDAPKFTMIPLARYVFYPLSIESQEDAVIYGRQFYESEAEVETKISTGEYDKEPAEVALSSVKGPVDDLWGTTRETIEGISSGGDDHKRIEGYKLVLKKDIDGDSIPEKYFVTFEYHSGRILSIRRYSLRKNIDCVVLFRFIKRDGRLLGIAMARDGKDQFDMIDDIVRHRQNVRSITDSPAFIAPNKMKDFTDFGSEDFIWRPGVTLWLPDELIGAGKEPHQMIVQNIDHTNNSADQEGGVMRYLETRLGPSQGMSGREDMNDPHAPATKTLALLRQSSFRSDAYISEYKRSVPALVDLMCALYYQYGPSRIKYMTTVANKPFEAEMEKVLFRLESQAFHLKASELALSPEYQMEKIQALIGAAAANPVILQMKPQILVALWNDYVIAARPADAAKYLIDDNAPMPTLPPPGGAPAPGGPAINGTPQIMPVNGPGRARVGRPGPNPDPETLRNMAKQMQISVGGR